jgi:hypothetical protein
LQRSKACFVKQKLSCGFLRWMGDLYTSSRVQTSDQRGGDVPDDTILNVRSLSLCLNGYETGLYKV